MQAAVKFGGGLTVNLDYCPNPEYACGEINASGALELTGGLTGSLPFGFTGGIAVQGSAGVTFKADCKQTTIASTFNGLNLVISAGIFMKEFPILGSTTLGPPIVFPNN